MSLHEEHHSTEFWTFNQHLERNRRDILEFVPPYLHDYLDLIHLTDRGTYAHSVETGASMLAVLKELDDVTDEDVKVAVTGATFHDLGKVLDDKEPGENIIDYINLPRKLTNDERAHVVATHTQLGYDHLAALAEDPAMSEHDRAFLKRVAPFALYHHEPEACVDDDIRPYVELLHQLDRCLGLSDANRSYRRTMGVMSPRDAMGDVITAMEKDKQELVNDPRTVALFSVEGIERVRQERHLVQ